MPQKFTLITIGDTVVEPFIRLNTAHIEESSKGAMLCMPYGSKIPYEYKQMMYGVGNSANAAVSAARLGVSTAFITRLGDDPNAVESLTSLKSNGVNTDYCVTEKDKSTNYHFVLWSGVDRTILIKHEKFNYSLPDDIHHSPPDYIYFSSLGKDSFAFHKEIEDYLKQKPQTRLCFQPGTFQLKAKDDLKGLYKLSYAICVNKEEAAELVDDTNEHDISKLLKLLKEFGATINIITDGPSGAYMLWENSIVHLPIYPDIAPPVERTGAGDAFFSTFVSFLCKGYDPIESFKRAPINSMSVVQQVGAQAGLLTDSQIEKYLKDAPEDYKIKIL